MIVYGRQVAREIARAGLKPKRVWCKKNLIEFARELFPTAEIRVVHPKIINSLCGSQEHQGIAIEVDLREGNVDEIKVMPSSIVVLLDGVQDVGNIGNIVRTCEFFGCSAVVLSEKGTPRITPAMVKSSAGAIFHITMMREQPERILRLLKSRGYRIYSFDVRGELAITDLQIHPPCVLCFGGEERGISPEVARISDLSVVIPRAGKTESLNVAAAVAVSLGAIMKDNPHLLRTSRI